MILCCIISGVVSKSIDSGVCQPYFASVKASEANLHVGPGKEYKILVKYVVKGVPVVVIAKYDNWRKIKDIDGTEGWIHKNLLSKERYVMIKNLQASMYKNPDTHSMCIANLKKNVIVKLIAVKNKWCNVALKYKGEVYTGWIPKNMLFGIFENEVTVA
jgi:SH3-like domain-containing protein